MKSTPKRFDPRSETGNVWEPTMELRIYQFTTTINGQNLAFDKILQQKFVNPFTGEWKWDDVPQVSDRVDMSRGGGA